MTEQQSSKTSSQVLTRIADLQYEYDRLSYGELVRILGPRAFGIATILFALPSALPFSAIPGVSFIFSLPIAFFAIQLVIAQKYMWLPLNLSRRTITTNKLAYIINKSKPYILRIEYFVKPRWLYLLTRPAQRVHGLVTLILVCLLMLPIPFSNFIFATLIIILGLGLAEGDGLFITIAYSGFVVYILAAIYFVKGMIQLLL